MASVATDRTATARAMAHVRKAVPAALVTANSLATRSAAATASAATSLAAMGLAAMGLAILRAPKVDLVPKLADLATVNVHGMQNARVMVSVRKMAIGPVTVNAVTNRGAMAPAMARVPKVLLAARVMVNSPAIPSVAAMASAATSPEATVPATADDQKAVPVPKVHRVANVLPAMDRAPKAIALRILKANHA